MRSRPTRRARLDSWRRGRGPPPDSWSGCAPPSSGSSSSPASAPPRLWRNPRLRGIRDWPVPDFPGHVLYYRIAGGENLVLRLLRPGVLADATLMTPQE